MQRRRGSLVLRLTLIATGVTTLALVTVLIGLLLVFREQTSRSVDATLRSRASDLQAAISAGGPAAVRSEELAEVSDMTGSVLASSRAGRNADPLLGARAALSCPGPDSYSTSSVRIGAASQPRRVRVLARCLSSDEVLAVAVPVEQQDDAQEKLLLLIAVAAPLLVAAVGVTLWRTVRAALLPVDALTQQARNVRAGESIRLALDHAERRDEVTRLGRTLQEMLDRLSIAFAREAAFVDDAAHELRTPLAVLRGEIELALSDLDDRPGLEQSLQAALAEAERLGRLTEDLLELARQRAAGQLPSGVPVDVEPFLQELSRRLHRVHPVTIEVVCSQPLSLTCDPDRLERVLTNLVANAAAARAARVRLAAHGGGGFVHLEVHDDGPGFPPDFLPTAFERFTRADQARTRSGAGLGLSLVRSLVTQLGGSVTAANDSALGGAVARVRLPVVPARL